MMLKRHVIAVKMEARAWKERMDLWPACVAEALEGSTAKIVGIFCRLAGDRQNRCDGEKSC